VDPCN